MEHKYANVIHAWADGKDIQFSPLHEEIWESYKGIDTPFFNDSQFKWRIKPEVLRYRVGLTEGSCRIRLAQSEADMRTIQAMGFVKWLTEWVEVEV